MKLKPPMYAVLAFIGGEVVVYFYPSSLSAWAVMVCGIGAVLVTVSRELSMSRARVMNYRVQDQMRNARRTHVRVEEAHSNAELRDEAETLVCRVMGMQRHSLPDAFAVGHQLEGPVPGVVWTKLPGKVWAMEKKEGNNTALDNLRDWLALASPTKRILARDVLSAPPVVTLALAKYGRDAVEKEFESCKDDGKSLWDHL